MRNWPFAALAALTFLLTATAAQATCPAALSELERIVLDPGHGGGNEGAVGVAGIFERFLTMDTAKRLQFELLACNPDLEVKLTRQHDVDIGLSERTHIANLAAADLFVSIHYNAAVNPAANGIEVFYLASDEQSPDPFGPQQTLIAPAGVAVASIVHDLERTRLHRQSALLAERLLQALISHTGAANRGVRQAHFRVLRGALMPAVVIELGFLTHDEEGQRLLQTDYQDALVEAMLTGIGEYAATL